MTPERLAELRKIAMAATPGPYKAFDNYVFLEVDPVNGERGKMLAEFFAGNPAIGDNENDTCYLAAFNRDTALELLDEIESHNNVQKYYDDSIPKYHEEIYDSRSQLSAAREVIGVLSEALQMLTLKHVHQPNEPHTRSLGDSYGWCDYCQEKVEWGLSDDPARLALESTREKRERLGVKV